MDHFCIFFPCLAVILYCLLLAYLWSPAEEKLTSLALRFMMVYCVFVTLPCGVLGWLWYLIVSIPVFGVLFTLISK